MGDKVNLMNWQQAVEAMRSGHQVRRASQQERTLLKAKAIGGLPIYFCGTEAMRLAAAWTDSGRPVMVFQGAGSKSLFIPEVDDTEANDWEIAP